jgi:hypothetical protein
MRTKRCFRTLVRQLFNDSLLPLHCNKLREGDQGGSERVQRWSEARELAEKRVQESYIVRSYLKTTEMRLRENLLDDK